ncbi:putative RNA-directed DNA polymerase [Helianthus annuus]|nr:putative RNA-directed DNA polymerase [Helianthus annuus]
MVIGRLISEEQSAFLAGRNITDGPLILNEAIAWMKKAKKTGMIFKVDINKAYDSLNWNFLESVMIQMNFPVKWRKWIMATLDSARASVLVNGSPTMEFKYARGLRQGDPLSPFLFVIAMEALTGIMKKAISEGIFEGLRCTNDGPLLSHLIYADDVIFLGKWSFGNALNLRRILRCFFLVSGLKVNLAKCSVFGVGINDEEVELMADCMNSKKGSLPFKHLGLTVGANMNLIRNWKSVIDIFKSRLSIWKAKSLSYGGRITLIKSVLNSLPTYFFSLYKAPAKVIDELERIRRSFFWSGSDENSYTSWMAWEKVIAPIEYGGLGFGSLRDANLAMLSKWWWRFKTDKDGLWRRVIWSVHHSERSWSPIPARISVPGPWKQIVSVQTPLNSVGISLPDLIWCEVGSESKALFWLDYWIGTQPLYIMFPLLFALEVDKLCRVSQRVVWESWGASFMWLWKRSLNLDDEVYELQNLIDMLNLFRPRAGPDVWIWKPMPTYGFSVAAIKNAAATFNRSVPEFSFFWNNLVPKKVGIVSWRALSERLPTKSALAARNIDIGSSGCPLCNEHSESSEHLFVACHFSQAIWLGIAQWCKIAPLIMFSLKDVLDIRYAVSGSKRKKKIINAIFQVVIWSIWRLRNEVIFRQVDPNMSRVIEETKSMSYLWIKNRQKASSWSWNEWRNFSFVM